MALAEIDNERCKERQRFTPHTLECKHALENKIPRNSHTKMRLRREIWTKNSKVAL